MKKSLIIALALCWGSVVTAPVYAQNAPGKPASTASKNTNKTKTAKAEKSKAASQGKTADKKTTPKNDSKAAAKTVAKAETNKPNNKTAVAKNDKTKADKGKTSTKTVAKAETNKPNSKTAVTKNDKTKADKGKTAAKTVAKAETNKPNSKTAVAKNDKTKASKGKAATKTVAKADKGKPAKTVAKKSDKPQKNVKTLAKAEQGKKRQPKATPLPAGMSRRNSVVAQGKQLIGTPYLWGGTSPQGFDCSGLVHYVYKKHGVNVPRSSRDQFASLPATDTPQPGDLVFFRKNGVINHVGIYVGGGNMLHAPQTGAKVRIESMQKPNWQRRYAGARRVINEHRTVAKAAATSAQKKTVNTRLMVKRAPDDISTILPNHKKTIRKTR